MEKKQTKKSMTKETITDHPQSIKTSIICNLQDSFIIQMILQFQIC